MKMSNQRMLSLLLAFVLALCLFGCSQGQTPTQSSAAPESPSQAPAESSTPPQNPSESVAEPAPQVNIPTEPLTIASGTAGGMNGVYGAVWVDIMMKNIPGLTISSQPGATAHNMQMVDAGEAEFGMVPTLIAYPGYYGMDWADGVKYQNLRSMFIQYQYEAVFVCKESKTDINDIFDLEGKIVNLGNAGSGADTTGRQLFDFFGITPKQIVNSSGTDQSTQLSDDLVDVVFYLGANPTTSLQEVELSHTLKFFQLTADQTKQFLDAFPYYSTGTLEAGMYKDLKEDQTCLVGWNQVVCSPDLDEDLVYLMVKTLFENLETLHAAHPDFEQTALENTKYLNIQLHPGAERYYKEMGVELPTYPPAPK